MHALLLALLLGEGFDYGSYGRVAASSDLEGGPGTPTNVVAHGSRLEEAPYLELDLYYARDLPAKWRVVTSVALTGDLQHFAGFSSQPTLALRNLYLAVDVRPDLNVWAGSRMYRGDDIYLFDYWPLDNLNTVGGGVIFHRGGWELALHTGVNRLADDWQYETINMPTPGASTTDQVVVLDRARVIESFKLTRMFAWRAKASLYFEAHEIGDGTHIDPVAMTAEHLPDDHGFVLGAQAGVWGQPNRYVNLWLRGATGLAAYGDLAVPYALAQDKRATDAREFVIAAAGNWDSHRFGVLGGAYARYFRAAGATGVSADKWWEGILSVRPHWFVSEVFGVAGEFSYQTRSADALDPLSLQSLAASVVKVTLMPAVITLAPGALGRPQLRVVYTASFLDGGARAALERTDTRLAQDTIHYLGIQAEWWFNSAYR